MFKFVKNISRCNPAPREYPIGAAVVIEKGEMVKMSGGTVVAIGDADQDDPILGVAANAHDGTTQDGVNNDNKIRVYDHADDIFQIFSKNILTATGGSTTTFVVSGMASGTITEHVDDFFNGSVLKIVSCAADSELVGKEIKVTDFTAATGTFTLGETLPAALASGDTVYLCPGLRVKTAYHYDLVADGNDIDWDTSGGEAIQIYGSDVRTMTTYVKLRLHQFGNDAAAK